MKIIKGMLLTSLISCAGAAYAESADVLKFDEQMWLGFDAVGLSLFYHDYSKVETNSATGRIKYTCHGHLADDAVLPDKPLKFYTGHMGYSCAVDAPYFQYIVTPSGKASIKCQSWPFQH